MVDLGLLVATALPSSWPMWEAEQGGGDQQPKVYHLQREISEEEELQEKIDEMEDTMEDFPEGEVQEVPEGAWEICQDEHTVEDIPGIDSMPRRVQEVLPGMSSTVCSSCSISQAPSGTSWTSPSGKSSSVSSILSIFSCSSSSSEISLCRA